MIFGLPWAWVAGAIVVTFLGGFLGGCEHEKKAFDEYKARIEANAEAQKREAEKIDALNKQKAKEIQSDYEKRIAAIRKSYSGVYNNGSGTVPGKGDTPVSVITGPTYNVLAEQCSETTQQLVDLQKFIRETL